MDDKDFKQQLVIALANNPEFVKQAGDCYNGKQIWFALTEQINAAVKNIVVEVTPK